MGIAESVARGLSQVEYIATIAEPNGEGAKAMLPTMREAVKLIKAPR